MTPNVFDIATPFVETKYEVTQNTGSQDGVLTKNTPFDQRLLEIGQPQATATLSQRRSKHSPL